MNPPSLPLLLAPAGSPKAFVAAIAAGADAVYFGGKQFGARQYATNFDRKEIDDAVRYAHLRGVSVYVTVNTLISEHELPEILGYILFLFQIGVDAVLIQDIGLLSLVRKTIPEMVIHASTQMGIHNTAGARYASSQGCRRIVLARELPAYEIEEIGRILEDTQTDLELFVHGALCYAYSGRCLLSSLIGGRSGNRGMCAQPCRKIYRICSGKTDDYGRIGKTRSAIRENGYLLSTRDLCLYPVLDRICRLPVAALKIEGRMRSPEYVATVVSVYRRALDAIHKGSFTPDIHDIAELAIAFSRGFTSGYISGDTCSQVMGREYPGNQGFFLGSVIDTGKGKVRVRIQADYIPGPGDGLVIRDTMNEEGFVLRNKPVLHGDILELDHGSRLKAGSGVFITNSRELELNIAALLSNPDKRFEGSIRISCTISIHADGTVRVAGTAEDCLSRIHPFECLTTEQLQPARTIKIDHEQIIQQVRKTGGTIYTFTDISVVSEGDWFGPPRVLNTMRREILESAGEAVLQSFLPGNDPTEAAKTAINLIHADSSGRPENQVQKPPSLAVIVSSYHEADITLQNGADRVYLAWNPDIAGYPAGKTDPEKIGIMVPGIIRNRELDTFRSNIQNLQVSGIHRFLVDSPGIAEYIRDISPDAVISGYYGMNITNSATVRAYKEFEFCTLSPELSEREIKDLVRALSLNQDSPRVAILVQGQVLVAVTEDNLFELVFGDPSRKPGQDDQDQKDLQYILQDERDFIFPFRCDRQGRTYIMNSSEHCLINDISPLKEIGISWFLIDARYRGEAYAGIMTRLWHEAVHAGTDIRSGIAYTRIRDEIIRMSAGGITRSGFRRGLSGTTGRSHEPDA
ncbi:MAG: DUF3656 domain-containing protein [Methanospirillum sp.]|nr:DUF3656 domain-containing protein [Methanospirillum sp.]